MAINFTLAADAAVATALTRAVVVAANINDNTLIAAPAAGLRLAVAFLKGQRTSGDVATTAVLIKAGATTIDYGAFSNDIPGQVFWDAASKLQFQMLPAATALIANHSAANSITYTVRYITVDA